MSDPYVVTVAHRLSELIRRHETTQSAVAHAAGMTRQQLSRIVSGAASNPGILTVERIVGAMGGTMEEYYGIHS